MFKIAILGPESTGKSELAKALALYYKVDWVPEYAREYIENLGAKPYSFNDVCKIAKKQIEQELHYEGLNSQRLVIFDTELIITKVWFEYCYKQVPDFVIDRLESRFFDYYLLCAPDLDWQPDPVREHGDDREFFFDWYKKEIENTKIPYSIIKGVGHKRTQNAIYAIDLLLNAQLNE